MRIVSPSRSALPEFGCLIFSGMGRFSIRSRLSRMFSYESVEESLAKRLAKAGL